MGKTKSITELVTDLQQDNDRLAFLDKLFNQACKHEFDMTVKELHEALYKLAVCEKKLADRQQQRAMQSAGQQNNTPQ